MSDNAKVIEALTQKTNETRRYLAVVSATAAFGLAVGASLGFTGGKDIGLAEGRGLAKTRIEQVEKETRQNAQYAADTQYSYLCWTFHQSVQKGAKTATAQNPYIVETNQLTADKCPVIPNRNVKTKIVF